MRGLEKSSLSLFLLLFAIINFTSVVLITSNNRLQVYFIKEHEKLQVFGITYNGIKDAFARNSFDMKIKQNKLGILGCIGLILSAEKW
jgi:hypothetical protein